ncbi:hypothetical protein PVAP13_3KG349154 [Panicum virgatum]|uniref:Uncharacterized protein n=1 Tax=Panicum virgatum TaxID=38727 RepID=A0A8T0UQE4_PANVG|nr:hypothetical protein PVAP13_3KG349154 [Panicum virgatum]
MRRLHWIDLVVNPTSCRLRLTVPLTSNKEERNGAARVAAGRGGGYRGRARRGGGAAGRGGAAGAVLLHLRGLAGGQRQQQLHRVDGARQLPALRDRLRRRALRPLQQRPHHRRRPRQASGLRRLHPPVRRRKQPAAPHRRQLRLRRRRHPGGDRPAVGRAHQLQRAGAELPVGGAGAGEHPGRRGLGGDAPEPVPLHGGHGQQRLPQQLLHAGLLQHGQPLHPGAVRRRAGRRLRPAPAGHVRLRRPEGGADGRGAGRVQPQRAGAAEPQRRRLRRGDRRRRPALQPAARRPRRPLQRAPRRALHLRRRVRHLRGPHALPRRARAQGHQRRVLRGGQEQRAGDVPPVPDALRQPPRVPLLGRLPPDGGGQRPRRPADIQRQARLRRPPRRHPDARAALDRAAGPGPAVSAAELMYIDHI